MEEVEKRCKEYISRLEKHENISSTALKQQLYYQIAEANISKLLDFMKR